MLKYLHTIETLTKSLGFPVMGEAFEGHPDDPTILEEYYLWDVPDEFGLVRDYLNCHIARRWELHSNVLTIYKDYR